MANQRLNETREHRIGWPAFLFDSRPETNNEQASGLVLHAPRWYENTTCSRWEPANDRTVHSGSVTIAT